ncbi:Helicase associated domain [Seminavis robusta]|uniref:Helicase associated domain n=1 Tax=Seminavis robusta TaxID=568900 RepID=A0A9N8DUA8_9STRA|nr:Helicase associated domain [Seminavis robusta]|eukprot:Sro356_g125260.1 Helicase associated domain (289) ;mRNA; r:13583-14449
MEDDGQFDDASEEQQQEEAEEAEEEEPIPSNSIKKRDSATRRSIPTQNRTSKKPRTEQLSYDWWENLELLKACQEKKGPSDVLTAWFSEQWKNRQFLSSDKQQALEAFVKVEHSKQQQQQQQQPIVVKKKSRKVVSTKVIVAHRKTRTWWECFDLLKEFKAKNGHCKVPVRHDEALNAWVRVQRRKRHSLDGAKWQALEDLGFIWDKGNNPWTEVVFQEVLEKKQEFETSTGAGGGEDAFSEYLGPKTRLHRWFAAQLGRLKEGALTEDQETRLESFLSSLSSTKGKS